MENMEKVILKGKLVTLRPLSLKDAPRFCQWFDDWEVIQFLSSRIGKRAPTLKQERKWIADAKRNKEEIIFAIDANDGTHIGLVRLNSIDYIHKNAEYGIFIGDKKYWGQGYGTEAGKLMIDYGFRKLKLRMIYLRYVAFNIRGEKSYKKLGFKPAGRFRQAMYLNKCYHDHYLMDLLKDEFLKNLKSQKSSLKTAAKK